MTYKCKINPSCVHEDLPHDLKALCACAAETSETITRAEFKRLRKIEVLRKLKEAQDNIARDNTILDNISVEVGRLVTLLNQSEAAA